MTAVPHVDTMNLIMKIFSVCYISNHRWTFGFIHLSHHFDVHWHFRSPYAFVDPDLFNCHLLFNCQKAVTYIKKITFTSVMVPLLSGLSHRPAIPKPLAPRGLLPTQPPSRPAYDLMTSPGAVPHSVIITDLGCRRSLLFHVTS